MGSVMALNGAFRSRYELMNCFRHENLEQRMVTPRIYVSGEGGKTCIFNSCGCRENIMLINEHFITSIRSECFTWSCFYVSILFIAIVLNL